MFFFFASARVLFKHYKFLMVLPAYAPRRAPTHAQEFCKKAPRSREWPTSGRGHHYIYYTLRRSPPLSACKLSTPTLATHTQRSSHSLSFLLLCVLLVTFGISSSHFTPQSCEGKKEMHIFSSEREGRGGWFLAFILICVYLPVVGLL